MFQEDGKDRFIDRSEARGNDTDRGNFPPRLLFPFPPLLEFSRVTMPRSTDLALPRCQDFLGGGAISAHTCEILMGLVPRSDVHAYAPPGAERGANKEETAVLPAINRHRSAIIIDTRCPHNESICTDVYRYTILSPVRLSRDYAADLPSPPLLSLSCVNSIILSLSSGKGLFAQLFQIVSQRNILFREIDRWVSITRNIMIRTFIESDSANLSSTVSNKPDARDTKNPTHLLWRGVVIRSWRIENAKGDEKRGGERRARVEEFRTNETKYTFGMFV